MSAAVTLEASQGRWSGLRGPLVTAAAVAAATVALHLRDPHRHGSWGLCPFKALTGWDCPACGGLRAVNDLGNGQFVSAAHSNLLFVLSVPVIVLLWFLWARRGWRGALRSAPRSAPRSLHPRTMRLAVAAGAVVMVAFTVLRNTPWGASLHAA
jgi:hypothetical protein